MWYFVAGSFWPIPFTQVMTEQKIYILTGPVRTGKTTRLVNWSEKRSDVFGILTPVIEQKRVFMDAHTRDQFPMEAGENESEVLEVGRFRFSKQSFYRAATIIREGLNKDGWLIIDEIGPLELAEKGFYEITRLALDSDRRKLLLVVREGLVEDVKLFFKIRSTELFDPSSA